MKLFAFSLLVVCVLLAVEAKSTKKTAEPKCAKSCPDDYSPVCGGVPNDKTVKPRLFGNQCILQLHNCENKANLVEISADQCKNAGGVRLF